MERISCRQILSTATEEELNTLLDNLVAERLQRKYNDIKDIYERVYKDWNQTCYEIMFKMMDVGINKEAYHYLSINVPYRYLLREVRSLQSIEALLLGGSGLLFRYPEDDYTLQLKESWNHLAYKYDLSPMRISDWNLTKVRPFNHPVLRLAQIATLLHHKEFIVNRIIACRTPEDVEELFCVEASEYWKSHFIPAKDSKDVPKRIGKSKSHILGINLVVPLQIAYSDNIGFHELAKDAQALLRLIPAEDNKYIRKWQMLGLEPKNAAESQAIIQLENEYCQKSRCSECPLLQLGDKL